MHADALLLAVSVDRDCLSIDGESCQLPRLSVTQQVELDSGAHLPARSFSTVFGGKARAEIGSPFFGFGLRLR